MDLCMPQKCSLSNHIIDMKDHTSIQMNVPEVGKFNAPTLNAQFKTYAICEAIRRMGESDDSVL
ncbi:40S ribosomal protein S21-like [Nannospalax galili]|uniref:40S ribosomal protein S21-like n=1 Tax=Nannospalax galili TaxID=1026970 RepID=UPI00081A151D|nr:40S ribosomal protein S21-like [Nannospalax galili]